MAGFRDSDKALFPIKNIPTVIKLFRNHLQSAVEPDLAFLSIVVGAIENSLTCRSNNISQNLDTSEPVDSSGLPRLPILELHTVEAMYTKFHSIIKSSLEPKTDDDKTFATRELVKKVSDVVWNTLTRSYYKDRAHLQSLFSYLNGNKLDCFGVAFAVVAGCQVLGYRDVHLALSEDHAWVVFGESGRESAEVTWHGKGNEDKRGQDISKGVSARSWLYVNNRPVVCTKQMEVAALVSAINPSLNATTDAFELGLLQQELLWLLYDLGHLKKYPMALGNLGDLEEIAPKDGRVACAKLFEEAIQSSRTFNNNQHVYPYTYQGGYFYRHKMYKEAFESWANAGDVIRLYNYSRDDEEIYKEFLEIACELIPHIMKVESPGFGVGSVLRMPECFANLLRFYDGICQWEEGSATPVLHIGWAKPIVQTISKFDYDVRAQVDIVSECDSEKPAAPTSEGHNNNNNYENGKSTEKKDDTPPFHPTIEALTAACSEKLLNPEFLLQGDGNPFVGGDDQVTQKNGNASTSKQEETKVKEDSNVESPPVERNEGAELIRPSTRPVVIMHSQKMKEIRELLVGEKLNTQAISLHLTAQSQVQVGKKGRDLDSHVRPKRARRE